MAQVDLMLMATLRDAENAIFHVEPGAGDFVEGFTTPWEMKGWVTEILNFGEAEYESLYVYGEFDAMRRAQTVYNNGGVAFLMIDDAMLGSMSQPFPFPTTGYLFKTELTINGENPSSTRAVGFVSNATPGGISRPLKRTKNPLKITFGVLFTGDDGLQAEETLHEYAR